MVREGGQIQVIMTAKLTNKVKEYVSELKLEKMRDTPVAELLRFQISRLKNEMMKKIEEQGAEIALLK